MLCPRFAVIRGGRLIAETTPGLARGAIEGSIYEGTISAESYERLVADPERCVAQAYLVEGRNHVRVFQPDGAPPPGFEPVEPTLEDAYLVLIKTGGLPEARDLDSRARAHSRLSTVTPSDRAIAAERGEG